MTSGSVLIVDDEALMAGFLSDLVEESGFEVLGTAATAAAALKSCGIRKPDIAIVDATLQGGEDGIALAEQLAERFGIKIIMMSGYADIAQRAEAMAVPLIAVLRKPCRPAIITAALESCIRK